ncbi:MAG: hypothetical protein KAG61_03715, partial [Bacteriovoracaceae bacterium]|nr:hypothetical protein [Bacteriovoracaceae bacterium]
APKKAAPKKVETVVSEDPKKMTREEAIAKYKNQQAKSKAKEVTTLKTKTVAEETLANPYFTETPKEAAAPKEEVPLDQVTENSDGSYKAKPTAAINAEYNTDDEPEEGTEGQYGFGWSMNDAFDEAKEDEPVAEALDEDEIYARGLDKKKPAVE